MEPSHRLGELQLAIMRVLWDAEEATVAEVREALEPDKGRALTTIATMLTKMERKGVVGHRVEGRQFVYAPIVSEQAVRRSMVADLTDAAGEHFTSTLEPLLRHRSLGRVGVDKFVALRHRFGWI